MTTLRLTLPEARDRLVGNRERLRVLAALDGTTVVSARELQNLIVAGEDLQRTVDRITAPKPRTWRDVATGIWGFVSTVLMAIGAVALANELTGVAG